MPQTSAIMISISNSWLKGAKSLELRAATSLAGIWQAQGKKDETKKVLTPVYEWFTEGFDTPDLIQAKELFDQLT